MAEVMAQTDRFDQIFVETERTRYRACDLRHLQRMRQSRTVMIALRCYEDLGLMLEPPERLGMQYPVTITLKACTSTRLRFGDIALRRGALCRQRREPFTLALFEPLANYVLRWPL